MDIKNIEIFIDYGTIPSLAYLNKIYEKRDDTDVIRLIALSRFNFNRINKFLKNEVNYYCELNKYGMKAVVGTLKYLLINKNEKYNLIFHLNSYHSTSIFSYFIELISKTKNINDVSMNLYDDGSEGIINRYRLFSEINDLNEYIRKEILELHQFLFEGRNINHLPEYPIKPYLWNTIYPTKYHLLSDSILNEDKMIMLRDLMKNYSIIKLKNLDESWVREIINTSSINDTIERLKCKKNIIFFGTTAYSMSYKLYDKLIELHSQIIQEHLDANHLNYIGSEYQLVLKMHPNSLDMEIKLKEKYPDLIFIPADIPFEIIELLGVSFEKFSGFSSTAFLMLNKDKIHLVYFPIQKDKENLMSDIQYKFSNLLVEMGIIEKQQVRLINLSL